MKTKMKCFTLLILALMLLLTSCDNTAENVDNTTSPTIESSYIDISFIKDIGRAQIAVAENGDIYLTDENRIYILDSKGNKKKLIETDKHRPYKLLTVYDGSLFVCNHRNELEEYNVDGAMVKKYDLLPKNHIIEKCYIWMGNFL